MTAVAWAFLGGAGVFAVGDWVAVGRSVKQLEYVCKPFATALLIGCALSLDPAFVDRRTCFVIALCFALAGDVLLMLPGDRFVAGLGAFLIAQLAFAVGFALHSGTAGESALGVAIAVVVGAGAAVRFVGALNRAGRHQLIGPVVAYLAAIGVMLAGAVASANGLAIAGALCFFASDALIAEVRFVAARRGTPVAIMVTYHAALALLVVSLLP